MAKAKNHRSFGLDRPGFGQTEKSLPDPIYEKKL